MSELMFSFREINCICARPEPPGTLECSWIFYSTLKCILLAVMLLIVTQRGRNGG